MSDAEANSSNEISSLEKTPVRRKRKSSDVLLSLEKLDRSPPDLWSEKNPATMNTPNVSSPPPYTKGLSQEDLNAMHQLGCLSYSGIFSEIRKLFDKAFQIGTMETREVGRGKSLGIYANVKRKQSQ